MKKQDSKLAAPSPSGRAAAVFAATAASEAGEADASRSEQSKAQAGKASGGIGNHLTVDSRLRDLLGHPASPVSASCCCRGDDRSYDLNMPLRGHRLTAAVSQPR